MASRTCSLRKFISLGLAAGLAGIPFLVTKLQADTQKEALQLFQNRPAIVELAKPVNNYTQTEQVIETPLPEQNKISKQTLETIVGTTQKFYTNTTYDEAEQAEVLQTPIPNRTLDSTILTTIPSSTAKSFTYSLEEKKLESQPAFTDPEYTTPEQKAQEKKKEEKKGFNPFSIGNLAWEIPLAAGVTYGIIKLTSKKITVTPPPPPTQITINYDVFNHSKKGVLTSFSKTYTAGQTVNLKISDITGIDQNGVDKLHLIVREDSINKRVGARIAFDKSSGTVTFTAPSASTNYDIFLLNGSSSSYYSKIDAWIDNGGGKLDYPRNCTYNREDRNGKTGPEQPILDTVSQLNSALDSGEINLGSITKVASGGNIRCSRINLS